MPHILIISSGPLCRNPRVLKEATTLGSAGFEVTVATIANIERFEEYDRSLLRGAPFTKVALERTARSGSDRVAAETERGFSWIARKLVRCGIELPSALGPYSALKRLAEGIPADLTIVHTELPFCIGASMIESGRRVAADFEDWHSRDLLPSAMPGRPVRLLDKTEKYLLQRAVFTSAPSGAMARALSEAHSAPLPLVIPNTFPLQEEPKAAPRNAVPSFFWFSQTIGEGRGLEEFLAAWSLTREESQVRLLGDISDAYRSRLLGLLPESHRGRIGFLPITSPEALPSVIAENDLGLALEPDTPPSRFLTATNKIFQYLNAGLAVIASPTKGQREVLEAAPGCGLLVNLSNPRQVASELDALLADRPRLSGMAAASRRAAVATYCWERSAPILIEAVRTALSSPSRGPSHP